jgi:hypothetical protein
MLMRRAIRWLIILAAAVLVIGLIAYARGPKHHHGDEVGSHGAQASLSQGGDLS